MGEIKLTAQQRAEIRRLAERHRIAAMPLARAALRREAAEQGIHVGEYIGLQYAEWLEAELLAVRHTLMQVQHAYTALENALTKVERLP